MSDPKNVATKLIESHLVEGEMNPGEEIGLRIDQTLTQDATGTMVMLELEAMGLRRAKTELSAQYVDHNLIQEDYKNPDDHLFLLSAAKRFGIWYSRPGNGVSHPVHMQHFGVPGKTLLGSDSHTCAAGAIGMLAMGAGGIEVAMAIAGEPFFVKMPEVWGVRLTGELPPWVSAKDVILEMLRRHTVRGGLGRVIEYYGPGLDSLSAWDRHVIANMGAELGATSTVFPADDVVEEFFRRNQRASDFVRLEPDEGATYDVEDEIDLSELVPLIAKPSSPGNVVPVTEIAGDEIYQAYVGSSANPGFRDFAVAAEIVSGKQVHPEVSFDINPSSRSILHDLARERYLGELIASGARIHQAGCNGCIGMGQAPATGRNSLRTTPRNFPGRSGTREDSVFLCSPETAAASALRGEITDPRDLEGPAPTIALPEKPTFNKAMLVEPLPVDEAVKVELRKGPNVQSLPEMEPLPEDIDLPIVLAVGDDVSTDEIMPAGARVLPYRSNIPKIAEFCFEVVDETYPERAKQTRDAGGHAIVGGENYGQGSSREHAAIAPRYLGLRAVIARSFARIHWQNLVSFGILPLTLSDPDDLARLEQGETVKIRGIHERLRAGDAPEVTVGGEGVAVEHGLTDRQIEVLLAGGLIPWVSERADA